MKFSLFLILATGALALPTSQPIEERGLFDGIKGLVLKGTGFTKQVGDETVDLTKDEANQVESIL